MKTQVPFIIAIIIEKKNILYQYIMSNIYLNEHTIPAIISIIYCVLLYLDSKINEFKRNGRDYFKAFIVIYSLSYLTIYLYTKYILNTSMNVGTPLKSVASLREEIFVGNPNF
jgi:hypothetical protein